MSKLFQNIAKACVSAETYQKMQEESRKWVLRCRKCGLETSYWDAGGIRWGAASKGKGTFGKCRQCNAWRWFSITKKEY